MAAADCEDLWPQSDGNAVHVLQALTSYQNCDETKNEPWHAQHQRASLDIYEPVKVSRWRCCGFGSGHSEFRNWWSRQIHLGVFHLLERRVFPHEIAEAGQRVEDLPCVLRRVGLNQQVAIFVPFHILHLKGTAILQGLRHLVFADVSCVLGANPYSEFDFHWAGC